MLSTKGPSELTSDRRAPRYHLDLDGIVGDDVIDLSSPEARRCYLLLSYGEIGETQRGLKVPKSFDPVDLEYLRVFRSSIGLILEPRRTGSETVGGGQKTSPTIHTQ